MKIRRAAGKPSKVYGKKSTERHEAAARKNDISRNPSWRRNADREKMLFGNNGRPKSARNPVACIAAPTSFSKKNPMQL